jgi:Protein of unknown function (DUF3224)
VDRSRTLARRLPVASAAALVLLASGSSPVGAGSDGGHGTRQVELSISSPMPVGGDFGCDPTDPTRCAGSYRNLRTLAGDFTGTGYQVGMASLLADGIYQGVGLVLFTGTVEGCGTGTLTIVENGRLDPVTGATWGTWEITAGQGTGELADLSGSLAADSRVDDVSRGTIRCG